MTQQCCSKRAGNVKEFHRPRQRIKSRILSVLFGSLQSKRGVSLKTMAKDGESTTLLQEPPEENSIQPVDLAFIQTGEIPEIHPAASCVLADYGKRLGSIIAFVQLGQRCNVIPHRRTAPSTYRLR